MQGIIKFIVGICVISLIFWNRFIRTRINIKLEHITLSYYRIGIICLLIILFTCTLYISIKRLLNIKTQGFNNFYIQKFTRVITNYVIESPKYIFYTLIKNINLKPYIEMPASYFTAYCYFPRTVAIILLQMPKNLVATFFILDIMYFQELKYFFISVNLLIPYLMARILFFIVRDYSNFRIDHIEKYITATKTFDGRIALNLKQKGDLPSDIAFEDAIKVFRNLCDTWFIYRRIHNYMTDIEAVRDHWDPYFQLYYSSCFLIGWISYLFTVLKI